MHIPTEGGGFHVKAGRLPIGPGYAAFKVNGNLPDNRATHGLPTIQGAILLFDASTGSPVALLDLDRDHHQAHRRRDGGRGALSRASGVAGRHHLRLRRAGPCPTCGAASRADIRRVFLFDQDAAAAERSPPRLRAKASMSMSRPSHARAARASDVIVTCTSAHAPFLGPADVRSGTFIAAIGADNPEKSEIDPALMARARVVTDLTEQCSYMGDLHHAIRAGTMRDPCACGARRACRRTQARPHRSPRDHAVRRLRRRHSGRRRIGTRISSLRASTTPAAVSVSREVLPHLLRHHRENT